MNVSEIEFQVAPLTGKSRRRITARYPGGMHRDRIDTDSAASRGRFLAKLAKKTGIDLEELTAALDDRLVSLGDEIDGQASAKQKESTKETVAGERKNQADRLVQMAISGGCEFWHTPEEQAYATIPVRNHHEHWPLRSQAMRRWLSQQFYACANSAPGAQALSDAIGVLSGKALYAGAEHDVHIRVAEADGRIYLDLANPDWQAVEISADGWRVVNNPFIRFRRARAMLPLPIPVAGGSLADLRRLVNVADRDWPLVAAWLLAAFRSKGPYPVLCLHGEQGSAKSTTARVLRRLVDPNLSPVRCEPRDPRDLMIAANNGRVLAFDNLSHIPVWLSDAFCRLSTGGGLSTRQLYTDDEEVIFDAQRPVILNGIEELATRGDLLDRSLVVNLPTIREGRRRTESDFWGEFANLQPKFLGAMLDAVSAAMRRLPSTTLAKLPRMADFAQWAVAGEDGLGLTPGAFMAAYSQNRAAGNDLVLESSPVAKAVLTLMAETTHWTGTPSELLDELEKVAEERLRRAAAWPKDAARLSAALTRVAPNLRQKGVELTFGRTSKCRSVTLARPDRESSVTTVIVPGPPAACNTRDDATTVNGSGCIAVKEYEAHRVNDSDDANDTTIRVCPDSLSTT